MAQELQNGWSSFVDPDGVDGLHVRGYRADDGQVIITGLYVHGIGGLSNEDLRGISLSRLGAYLAAEADRLPSAAELDATAADETTVGELEEHAGTLASAKLEQVAAGWYGRKVKVARREKLGRPDGTNPDAFYELVSRAYREYAAQSKAPARSMADEADVPVTTVHRWIREARRRGFLAEGRRGRVM